jgi:hypothetical protein
LPKVSEGLVQAASPLDAFRPQQTCAPKFPNECSVNYHTACRASLIYISFCAVLFGNLEHFPAERIRFVESQMRLTSNESRFHLNGNSSSRIPEAASER